MSNKYTMPAPRDDANWRAIKKTHGLPEPRYKDSICSIVTLPAGWVVLPGQKHHWIVYDENGNARAMVYLTENIGFTIVDPPNKK